MIKPSVGVYRTVFPRYSETFISEQMRSLAKYQPVLITRELVREVNSLPVVTLGKKYRILKNIGFTGLGLTFGFDKPELQRKLNLIHAHFAPDAVLVLPLAEKLNIPLVVTCHGSDVTVSIRHIAKSMKLSGYRYLIGRRRLFNKAALFIAVSDFLRKKMVAAGFPEKKVVRHYVGIDTARFTPRCDAQHLPGRRPYVLSIARHTDVKGLDLLLRAFALVANTHPDLRLVQIGGGELTESLKNLASTLKIEGRVDFLGPMPSEKVLPYIQDCLGVVLSSRRSVSGAEESFGLVLIEASACGVPCIGTRVGGIPEAIVDGETGFLVEPENVNDLAEKVSRLVSEPELAASMGKRGRKMVCESFDLHKQTAQLEVIYTQLLAGQKEGPRL
ncbi:MAG: glycosyltransferase [Azonexus sp.]|nr:glycosyltransferase [Azonexus sp.]